VAVEKISNVVFQPDGRPTFDVSGLVWIECAWTVPGQQNTAADWGYLMQRAVGKLSVAHPGRTVFLILAAGLEWMTLL
jgi:hypothetical protein